MLNSRSRVALLSIAAVQALAIGPAAVCQVQTDAGSVAIIDESVATFAVGASSSRVFQVLSTAKLGTRPKFRYEPVWMPRCGPDGALLIDERPLPTTGVDVRYKNYRLSFTVLLASPNTQRAAAAAIKAAASDETTREGLQDGDIEVFGVKKVTFTLPDLKTYCPNARLVTDVVALSSTAREIALLIDVRGEASLRNCKPFLNDFLLRFTADYAVRDVTTNEVRFEMRRLKSTELVQALSGLGTVAYVQRKAYQQLVASAVKDVSLEATIQDPATARRNLSETLLAAAQAVREDELQWDAAKWKQVYHGEDLEPTRLQGVLNKTFTKESGKDEWKTGGSSGGKAEIGIPKVLTFGGEASSTYSSEGLKEFLRENSIEVDIKGDIIIPRSIDLVSVSTGTFSDQDRVVVVDRQVGKASERAAVSGEMSLRCAGQPDGQN